jgi:CHAT domain-containing protein
VTDGRLPTPGCLDSETLAAFMDGRLEPRERAVVEAHLAECEDCYEVWMDALQTTAATQAVIEPVPVPARRRFTRPQQWAAVAGLAASIAAIAWLGPSMWALRDPAVRATRDMRKAVGEARFAEARLSASFDWGVPPASLRGSTTKPSAAVQQAALAATRLTERASTASTLRAAGTGHLILGQFDEAIGSFEASLALDADSGLADVDLGAALYERWRLAGNPIDAARSVEALERARTKRAGDSAVLFNLALALEATERLDDAAGTWESFLKVDPQSPWAAEGRERLKRLRERQGPPPIARGTALTNGDISDLAARAPWRLLDYIEQVAIPDWIAAAQAGRRSDLSAAVAMAQSLAGAGRDRYPLDLLRTLDSSDGRRRSALADGLKALQASREAFDRSKYAESQRQAEDAVELFSQARWTPVDAEMQVSFTLFSQDRREAALSHAEMLSQRARSAGYLKVAARAAYMNGRFLIGRGELDRGVSALTLAQRTYEESGDRSQAAATRALLVEAYRNAGRPEEAWSQLFAATSLVDRWTRPRLRYLVLTHGFHHVIQGGHFHTAIGMTPVLSRLVEEWNDPLYRADFALLEAGLYERMQRPAETRAAANRSRAFLAAIPDEAVRQQYEQVLRFTVARAVYATAPDDAVAEMTLVIERLASLKRPFQSAEAYLLRGRAHRVAKRLSEAERDWRAGIDALEQERAVIHDDQLAVPRADRQWSLYAELIDLKSDSPPASMGIAERGRSRSLLSALDQTERADPGNDSVETVTSWLPGDTGLLVYAVLPQRIASWLVTSTGIEPVSAPITQTELQLEVNRYVTDVQRRGGEADSVRLSTLLIPQSWAKRPTSRLVIIPDGVLHQVPFGALRLPGTVQAMAEMTTLSMSPSLAMLRAALAQPRPSPSRALVVGFGAAQPEFGLAQLPQVANEVQRVSNAYNGRATPLLGEAATPAAVRQAAGTHTILHLAGHAFTDERRPWQSRIFLAPGLSGDSMNAAAISSLTLARGSTVILSACSTASGKVFRGEGALSLARSFLAAGASAVLASQWPVRDDDTERIMVDLHRHLAGGATLADALASVQRQEIKKNPSRWQPWMVLGAQSGS